MYQYREFQKHEALTVEKLEKALSQIQNDSGVKETESGLLKELGILANPETDKENVRTNAPVSHPPPAEDDMEITASASTFPNIQQLMALQKTVVQTVEMDLSANSLQEAEVYSDVPELNQTAQCADTLADMSKEMEMSMQEIRTVEMSDRTVCSSPAAQPNLPLFETTSFINKEMEISYQDIETVEKNGETVCSSASIHLQVSQNETKEMQMTVDETSTVSSHTLIVNQKEARSSVSIKEVEFTPVIDSPKAIIPDYYDESSEFTRVSRAYGWRVTRRGNELTMQKLCDSFTLRFLLGNEYLNHNFRHCVIEEIEVDTSKGLDKFSFSFLLQIMVIF